MALTPSTFMLNNGDKAPQFKLPDTTGNIISLDNFIGCKALVIMFWSNHCPFVKLLKEHISLYARGALEKHVKFVAINSNDIEKYPADAPNEMVKDVKEFNYPFPYLFDQNQSIAKAYKAACTPDFFVFDESFKLSYMGQYDAARPGNGINVTGEDLDRAIQAIVNNREIDFTPKPAAGCNIKWKPGNEPDYFG